MSASQKEFIKDYETALGTQEWSAVAPLIHENASVTFSDGSVHKGKAAVRAAYERNFEAIKNEDYKVANVHWLLKGPNSAAYTFDFNWSGLIGGKSVSGAGRGTAVLVLEDNKWQLLAEHLGPYPKA